MYNAFLYIVSNDGVDMVGNYPFKGKVRNPVHWQNLSAFSYPIATILQLLLQWYWSSDVRKYRDQQW